MNEVAGGRVASVQYVSESIRTASVVVRLIAKLLPEARSCIEFGTENGVWATSFERLGFEQIEICVERSRQIALQRSNVSVSVSDLHRQQNMSERFDICVALQSAWRVPPLGRSAYVRNVTALSDVVLFSCAPPIGEREPWHRDSWLSDWVAEFEKSGYMFYDTLRPRLWTNSLIDWQLAESICIFSRRPLNDIEPVSLPIDWIHPSILDEVAAYLRKNSEAAANEQGARAADLDAQRGENDRLRQELTAALTRTLDYEQRASALMEELDSWRGHAERERENARKAWEASNWQTKENADLSKKIDELEAELRVSLDNVENMQAAAISKIRELEEELSSTHVELREKSLRAQVLQSEFNAIKNSTIWRASKPFRSAVEAVRGTRLTNSTASNALEVK